MGRVIFLGNSLAQLRSLPPKARAAFVWAIDQLEHSPTTLPIDPDRGVETIPLSGDLPLFRIAVRIETRDPGYRGVYHTDGPTVHFIRFARRDPATYKGLRKALRLLQGIEEA